MSTLYLMCGPSGAGKSTWIQNNIEEDSQVWVSRDVIRFSLVKEGDPYFSQETKVFNIFVNTICNYLLDGYDVYADATHLNMASRTKLIRCIPKHLYDELAIIVIKPDITIVLNHNEMRKGTRAYVPEKEVRRMYYKMIEPTFEEGFDHIYYVRDDELIELLP